MWALLVLLLVGTQEPSCGAAVAESRPRTVGALALRSVTCGRVVVEARRQKVPVALAVWLTYHESRFKPGAVSRSGKHYGALQAKPCFWCDGGVLEGCDLIKAGVRALATNYRAHGRDWVAAVAHFNGGNAPRREAWRYARKVVERARDSIH